MPKLTKILISIALLLLSIMLGLGIWYIRQTNSIAQIVLDATPLDQSNGRTNIAFFGVGGEGHEGSDLTDTILLASLGHTTGDLKLISVPRDIWVDPLKIKINSAYHYGNEKGSGEGLKLAKSALTTTLGIPIHYSILIDFDGFIKLVDAVGGIDVKVKTAFDDYKYPIPGQENAEPESARYEHLHFDSGLTEMDGITALKFARSRHAEGEEGTDFARGARQQLIISALYNKILSSKTLLNQDTLSQIYTSLSSSLDTDIHQSLSRSFISFALKFERTGQIIQSGAITPYLDNPKNLKPYGGAWVLIPSTELQTYVAQFLSE